MHMYMYLSLYIYTSFFDKCCHAVTKAITFGKTDVSSTTKKFPAASLFCRKQAWEH